MISYWYGALNQKVYPEVGDIDDCWVVASIWAIRYQTKQSRNLPTAAEFRRAAGNLDNPHRADGGNRFDINKACDNFWPTVRSISYATQNWNDFARQIKAGASASVATSSRLLPLNYGFNGPHQIAVVYRNGYFRVMNPLQRKGSEPTRISEASLKRAVMGLNGWVMAVIFPKINLGTFRKRGLPDGTARRFRKFRRTKYHTWASAIDRTTGFRAKALPPKTIMVKGRKRKVTQIMTGKRAGWFINVNTGGSTFTP